MAREYDEIRCLTDAFELWQIHLKKKLFRVQREWIFVESWYKRKIMKLLLRKWKSRIHNKVF